MKSIFLQFAIVPQALCEYGCVSESVMRGVCVCAHVRRAGGGWASECVREHNDVMKDDMGFGLGAL